MKFYPVRLIDILNQSNFSDESEAVTITIVTSDLLSSGLHALNECSITQGCSCTIPVNHGNKTDSILAVMHNAEVVTQSVLHVDKC